jgi:hypothetical protein
MRNQKFFVFEGIELVISKIIKQGRTYLVMLVRVPVKVGVINVKNAKIPHE